jgi:hypothetical protein
MAMATAKQGDFLMRLHSRSEQHYQDWMKGYERKRLIQQASTLPTPISQLDWFKRFVLHPEDETLTECLKAGWIERWPMVPPRYAITGPGSTQFRRPKADTDEHA